MCCGPAWQHKGQRVTEYYCSWGHRNLRPLALFDSDNIILQFGGASDQRLLQFNCQADIKPGCGCVYSTWVNSTMVTVDCWVCGSSGVTVDRVGFVMAS